jgi:hypothetical protein
MGRAVRRIPSSGIAVLMVLVGVGLLPSSTRPALAAPAHDAASCVAMAAIAQAAGCQWHGNITISQIEDRTMSTPIDGGGSVEDVTHINDVTTIQASGTGSGDADREYSFSHTVTRHEVPRVQCGPGQPFTTGTHTVVQSEQRKGNADGSVDVTVTVGEDGKYSISTGRPVPATTGTTKYEESWNICKAPPANNSSHDISEAGSDTALDIGAQGQVDPNNPTVLEGTESQPPLTLNWHLDADCAQCDDLQQRVNDLEATLETDAALLRGLTDSLLPVAPSIGGEAPELGGVGADIASQLISLQAAAQRSGTTDSARNVAYAEGVADWLVGDGVVQLNQLLSGLGAANGVPLPLTAQSIALMQAAQGAADKVRDDREQLVAAQTNLQECLGAAPSALAATR